MFKILDWILIIFLKIRAKSEYYRILNNVENDRNKLKDGFKFVIKYFRALFSEDDKDRKNLIPECKTLGSYIMVRLAGLVISLYKSILKIGASHEKAMKLTSKISWFIYNDLTIYSWKLTRIFSTKNINRVSLLMKFFIEIFPYKNPGYNMRILKTKSNRFEFNVYKCPPSQLFGKFDLLELCTISFCDLDYPLADIWSVKLNRTKTLAKKNELCNFKFCSKHVENKEE